MVVIKRTIGLVGRFEENMVEAVRAVLPEDFSLVSIESPEQREALGQIDYMITRMMRIDQGVIDSAARLKLIQRWGVGYDKVDVTYATQKGIPVAISAGVNAASVSEHAVLLMLAVLRRLVEADGAVHQGLWADKSVLKNAGTIRGRTVGLLGFGNIAHMVAEKVSAFGARVQYYDVVRADPAVEERLHASYVPFEELMATSDIVSVHIPLLPQTTGMVDEKAIARMKPGTILINTARGGIVDEDALARALEEGRLRGAGLDTFAQEPPAADSPLLRLKTVIATPHIGGTTDDNNTVCAQHCVENIAAVDAGRPLPPRDLINPEYAAQEPERTAPVR